MWWFKWYKYNINLLGYDADQSYPLELEEIDETKKLKFENEEIIKDYEFKEPTQKPIKPPYKTYMDKRESNEL